MKAQNFSDAAIKIPTIVFDAPEISPFAKMLWARIYGLVNEEWFARETDKELAEIMKCTIRKVQRGLKELRDKEFLLSAKEYSENGRIIERRLYPLVPIHELQERASKKEDK